jgi:hypothetical protein
MIWLAWRQSRATWLAIAAVVAIYAGLAGYERLSGEMGGMTGSLSAYLGLFLALVVGAPLVGRELEQGTYRFVWAQSISRRRWLTTRLGVAAVQLAASVAAVHALINWVTRDTAAARGGAMTSPYFLGHGLMPYALALAAVTVGVAAGAVTRRTLPAVGTALVGYIAVTSLADGVRGRLAQAWGSEAFWSAQLAVGAGILALGAVLLALTYRLVGRPAG